MAAKRRSGSGSAIPASVLVALVGSGCGISLVRLVPQSLSLSPGTIAAAAASAATTRFLVVPPVITNLKAPAGKVVRLQIALEVDASAKKIDQNALSGDLVAYLRAISLDDLSGAAGLKHLREDLADRLETRLGSPVKGVIVQDLVVQ